MATETVDGLRVETRQRSIDVVVSRPNGSRRWRHTIETPTRACAAVAVEGDAVYVVVYDAASTGATLVSLDPAGAERWRTRLEALGPIMHSQYSNVTVVRIVEHRPVVFGWEGAGRYVEAIDPSSGRSTYHWRELRAN